MCYEDENKNNGNCISLNELIKDYCGVNSELKYEIHKEMTNNPYLWKTRPITDKLNYYAGCDVLYLPKIYDIICRKCDNKKVKNITMKQIFDECRKYLEYININQRIKNYNKMNLEKNTKLKGLIKNFQKHCVYIQLNIGYTGIVDTFSSVLYLKENYKLGDIADFVVISVENIKNRLLLDICNLSENINNNNKIDSRVNLNIDNILNGSGNENEKIQNLNIYKESFFPKSYKKNMKANGGNKYMNDSNNINNSPNFMNNNNMSSNKYLYAENDNKKANEKKIIEIVNTNSGNIKNIFNGSNYGNGLCYNEGEECYYTTNEESNSDYIYTLKQFNDSPQNNYHNRFFESHKYK